MKIPLLVSNNEKYYCNNCNKELKYLDVFKNWKCPTCDEIVRIKIEIENYFHNCYRLTPDKLKVGELVTLDGKHIHSILDVSKSNNGYRLALEGYGVITVNETQIFVNIDGTWYDPT